MFDSNRGPLFGAVTAICFAVLCCLIFAMGLSIGSLDTHYSQRADQTSQQYVADTKQRVEHECAKVGPARVLECVQEIVEASRESQRAEYDLSSQQEMAVWARWTFISTVAGLFVSIAALAGLFWSLAQTRTAIWDNRHFGEAQVRAYLSVSKVEASLHPVANAGNATWVLTIKVYAMNAGQTPARNVNCTGAIISVAKKLNSVIAFESRARNEDFLPTKEYLALAHSVPMSTADYEGFKHKGFSIRVNGRIKYDIVVGSMGRFTDYEYLLTPDDRGGDPPRVHIERSKTGNDSD
ncbi:exported hypothetical protein [Mesorhizobium plurifarium]|uniref:Transmembrane protein n=1 Tax=Mesorhizobium plurifarium TaxID=69974 RepID=A0A090GVP4_MESPL|nr:exported hypothetical protein [Mesorhizobium plurifarium]